VFGPVTDGGGNEITITVAADRYVSTTMGDAAGPGVGARVLRAPGRIKIRSGTSGAPVAQGADRVIGVVVAIANE
jgi:hypothetical protein